MTYADLEPFYDRAEYELGVSGKAGNLQGRKIDGGNVFEAPRRREYPLPPLLADQSGVLFEAGARKLGYHPFSSPRAILSQPYQGGRAAPTAAFARRSAATSARSRSILVTKLPEADATGNFKLLTGAMCYRVNSDNSGRVTGVSYYGPDGSDNTIEAEIVILAPFIYDNTRLLLLSKTEKFPNGLANSSGQVGKHLMAHIGAKVFAAFDDRFVNIYMGPSAQKHTLDDFNADNFDHSGLGFIRGAQISVGPADLEAGPIGTAMSMNPPPGMPRWGAAYRDFLAKYFARYAAIVAQTENLPYADQTIDLDPDVRDQWGLPAPRLTYDWRRPNELGARRVPDEEDGGDRPRDGRDARVASAPGSRRPGRAPRGRHAHGQRSEDFGGEPLRPELGHPEPLHHRQLDLPVDERLQSDAHDPGARLHERRCDRESLQEKSRTARIAGTYNRARPLAKRKEDENQPT